MNNSKISNNKNKGLLIAVLNKEIDNVKKLLDEGADVNFKNDQEQSLLLIASRYGPIEIVKLLLDCGADINNKGENWSPLSSSVRYSNRYSSLEIVKLLLDRGADINNKNHRGLTPLMFAISNVDSDSSIETVNLLLERGADINIKDNDGDTSLMFASNYNKSNIIKMLLEREGDPFIKNNKENTAYDFCANYGCRDLISKYIWKRLYNRDIDTAKRYAKSVLCKDVWELILLNKRQQQLCSNLSSNKNREVLKYFALELNIPITDDITKPKLCGLISRYLAYGKYYSEASKKYTEKKINEDIKNVKDMASRFGLDRNKPMGELLKDLALILG